MDFKKAVESKVPIVNNTTTELVTSKSFTDIEKFVNSMRGEIDRKKPPTRRDESALHNAIIEYESNLQELLKEVKERFFFDGLCTNLTTMDIIEVFKQCAITDKCEDDGSTILSDDEAYLASNYDQSA